MGIGGKIKEWYENGDKLLRWICRLKNIIPQRRVICISVKGM